MSYRWLVDEKAELIAMRTLFVVSELGDVATSFNKLSAEIVKQGSSRNKELILGLKNFMISGLGDLLIQTKFLCEHLELDFDRYLDSYNDIPNYRIQKDYFMKMYEFIGKMCYSIKHIVRGTSKIDRQREDINLEIKEFIRYMRLFIHCFDFKIEDILQVGQENYNERYEEWIKAGRKGKWV